MWQAVHYDNPMFTTAGTSTGQISISVGATVTANSPLKPFFDENLEFRTSNSVSGIRNFGCTYPEIDGWSATPAESAAYVRARINTLYNTVSPGGSAGRSRRHHKDIRTLGPPLPSSRY